MKNIIHRFIKQRTPSLASAPAPLSIGVFTEGMAGDTYARRSLEAFADGIHASGDSVTLIDSLTYAACDIAVIFGDVRDAKHKEKRMRLKAEVKGRHIHRGLIVIDTAILTRSTTRGASYRRIGLDGILRGEGDFCNAFRPADRWEKISRDAGLAMQPWKEDGEHILIALQRPVDASLKSTPSRRPEKYRQWVLNTVEQIRGAADRPIHVRPHPASMTQADEVAWLSALRRDLPGNIVWSDHAAGFADILKDCRVCVTFNSGAGVDAALAGVPVLAADTGSFAWEIALHDAASIETLLRPDRAQWLNNLAYAEWSLEEMREGLPWRHLKPAILERL